MVYTTFSNGRTAFLALNRGWVSPEAGECQLAQLDITRLPVSINGTVITLQAADVQSTRPNTTERLSPIVRGNMLSGPHGAASPTGASLLRLAATDRIEAERECQAYVQCEPSTFEPMIRVRNERDNANPVAPSADISPRKPVPRMHLVPRECHVSIGA